ncbi:MAG: hypothetical protein ACYSW3_25295 [Planctomycetota bacterium]|jgi:hypothetical protein
MIINTSILVAVAASVTVQVKVTFIDPAEIYTEGQQTFVVDSGYKARQIITEGDTTTVYYE